MESKEFGKIVSAEFGILSDRPFLLGLYLEFAGPGWGCGDGGRYLFNTNVIGGSAPDNRREAALALLLNVDGILRTAKVNSVSQLVGKPVEVTFDGNMFKAFRILTEVL